MSDRENRQVNISIDLAAIRHNLKRARESAPDKKIFSVIKADAYGHGATRILPALADTDAFAVANVAEGNALRHAKTQKPILVLQGFHSTEQLSDCLRAGLWPVIHHMEQLAMLPGKSRGPELSCWVKVDTGMGRLGFKSEQVQQVCNKLQAAGVKVKGLLTHFASADRQADISTDRQLKVFKTILLKNVEHSAANSAALLDRPDSHFDWVRPGIMLYGANPMEYRSGESQEQSFCLQPAMRVTAPVIAVRELKRGDRVGYGGTYECSGPTRVAIVGAGYGDGYPRTVAAGTCVVLGNRRCPIIGRVSMDSMSVDISALSVNPPIDYPVTLWGHVSLLVDEVADRVGTIPYELLCSIRGKRSWHDPATEVNVRKISDN